MRLLVTVAGFAIGFVLPVLAQEQNMVDPEVRQQIEAVLKRREEAINKNDAAAVAALYTQYAAAIRSWESEGGLASGQQAIEKRYATELASSPGEFVDTLARVCPAGSEMCAISEGSWGLWKGYYVGFMFGMPIAGRSVWNMSFLGDIDRATFRGNGRLKTASRYQSPSHSSCA